MSAPNASGLPPPASQGLVVAIAGPAGSGKSTLCDRLVESGQGFSRIITATTRMPRAGERDGVHYHFLSPGEFESKVAAGEFLEWAWVHGDRRYGTLATSVLGPLAAGRDLVLNLDVQGVASLRRAAATDPRLGRALVTIFIRVDHDRLLARMRERGTDDDAEMARRMATAETELLEASKFDHVIESRTRDEDFQALLGVVAAARRRIRG